MNEKRNLSSLLFYGVIILVLAWGILGSLYLGGRELIASAGHLFNWEWGKQFYVASKGIGMHLFAGLFLFALAIFLAWMGKNFLGWVSEDTKKKRARDYKRRNYR